MSDSIKGRVSYVLTVYIVTTHMLAKTSVSGSISVTQMTMPGGARAAVQAIFSRHPLLANCLTYGALYTGSELLQQSILR